MTKNGRMSFIEGVNQLKLEREDMAVFLNGGNDVLNPKDQMASTKLPVHLVPTELIRETAKAMDYGAHKAKRKDGKSGYGEWNWREAGVSYTVMVSAIIRHALELLDGKDIAEDSKVSHLGHIAAGVGIILDAKRQGILKDDRPKVEVKND